MNRGRILATLALLVIGTAPARASLLVDPFVEDFRVGQEALLDAPDADGWPAGLDAPAHWSAGWDRALTRVVLRERARDPRLLAWRLGGAELDPLLEALEHRRGWLERESRVLDALAARAAGSDALAARLAEQLAEEPVEGEWTAEERFVWRLRARAWSGAPVAEAPWPELLDLSSADRKAGWRIWKQRCAAAGRRPLEGLQGDLAWARWLAGAARGDLSARELERTFPDRIVAGLGAAVLRGDALDAHLRAHPDLPADSTLQDWWLQGMWRREGHSAAAARRLADLEGVLPEHRAAFLRRAADKDFSRGRWDTALPDLEAALALSLELEQRRLTDRVRLEVDRARVKAAEEGRADLVARLSDLGAAADRSRGPLRDGLRDRIRAGGSPDFADASTADLHAVAERAERLAWELWDRIGTQHGVPSVLDGPVGDLESLRQRLAPILAGRLAGTPDLDALRRWALLLDAAALHPGPLPFQSSPLPALARRAQSDQDMRRLHALYGAAFLLRDPRGQLAAWIYLPASDLSLPERLLLNHPLPADPGLLDDLLAADAPPELLLAIARNESLFDPAVRSYAGALGWMQIMPFHYPGNGHQEGEVLWRRRDLSLRAGARILARDGKRYDHDPYRTLAAYNAGPGAVNRWNGQLGEDADRATFLAWIGYPSTRRYVEKVLIDRLAYRWLFDNLSQGTDFGTNPDEGR